MCSEHNKYARIIEIQHFYLLILEYKYKKRTQKIYDFKTCLRPVFFFSVYSCWSELSQKQYCDISLISKHKIHLNWEKRHTNDFEWITSWIGPNFAVPLDTAWEMTHNRTMRNLRKLRNEHLPDTEILSKSHMNNA